MTGRGGWCFSFHNYVVTVGECGAKVLIKQAGKFACRFLNRSNLFLGQGVVMDMTDSAACVRLQAAQAVPLAGGAPGSCRHIESDGSNTHIMLIAYLMLCGQSVVRTVRALAAAAGECGRWCLRLCLLVLRWRSSLESHKALQMPHLQCTAHGCGLACRRAETPVHVIIPFTSAAMPY